MLDDQVTQRQLDYLAVLGVRREGPMTRAEASNLIRMALDADEDGKSAQVWQEGEGSSINATHRKNRSINELIGLCRGILLDGQVNTLELDGLRSWVSANTEAASSYPMCVVVDFLTEVYADGMVTQQECDAAAALLGKIVGMTEGGVATAESGRALSSSLPLDDPMPPVIFQNKVFVFTGKLAYAKRDKCEEAVNLLGGIIQDSITKQANYLVIGTLGSEDWANSSFGRKIEKAVEYREKFGSIAVISESHWVESMEKNSAPPSR